MKYILKNYINKLTINDIKNYLDQNNYIVSDKDINTIYKFIKRYWEDIYNKDLSPFQQIKKEVDYSTYNLIINLYNKYKDYLY